MTFSFNSTTSTDQSEKKSGKNSFQAHAVLKRRQFYMVCCQRNFCGPITSIILRTNSLHKLSVKTLCDQLKFQWALH